MSVIQAAFRSSYGLLPRNCSLDFPAGAASISFKLALALLDAVPMVDMTAALEKLEAINGKCSGTSGRHPYLDGVDVPSCPRHQGTLANQKFRSDLRRWSSRRQATAGENVARTCVNHASDQNRRAAVAGERKVTEARPGMAAVANVLAGL